MDINVNASRALSPRSVGVEEEKGADIESRLSGLQAASVEDGAVSRSASQGADDMAAPAAGPGDPARYKKAVTLSVTAGMIMLLTGLSLSENKGVAAGAALLMALGNMCALDRGWHPPQGAVLNPNRDAMAVGLTNMASMLLMIGNRQ
ncbi:MAG: hypothetical protein KTR20_07470 [Cellvibrionaceae bacterium]|nr:hypothetical protein [Cellvibrionaceae bacterium]